MTVGLYNADLWCLDCTRRIREQLGREGKAPPDPQDEYSYDSGDYPKTGEEGSADCPNHCAAGEACLNAITLPSGRKVGELLTEELTERGREYVREAIKRGGEVAQLWREHYDLD